MELVFVLGVNASLRRGSHTRVLLDGALRAARDAGARVETWDLREKPLPLFDPKGDGGAAADELGALIERADALVVGSPEYHGSMSGAAKNFFDHYYDEFAGKLVGLVCATGGSQGTSALTHLRATCQYVHAWTLPFNVSAKSADFSGGKLVNARTKERLKRLGRDVAVYGPLLQKRFAQDVKDGAGFAGFHA